MNLYTYRRFRQLSEEQQIHQLSLHGQGLDLACTSAHSDVVLFGYNDFYVELEVKPATDEIVSLRSFRSLKKLAPYLQQIDISEINALLTIE